MDKKRLNLLSGALRRALGRKSTCAAMGMSKEEIARVCLAPGYEKKLSVIFDGGALTCAAVEEAFSIRFENVGMADFQTVRDVVDYIEGKLK